jgi:hypothetical protein
MTAQVSTTTHLAVLDGSMEDLVGGVGVCGAGGALCQKRQQATRHQALPRRRLACTHGKCA